MLGVVVDATEKACEKEVPSEKRELMNLCRSFFSPDRKL
jgi:hypothetical protein